MSTRHAAAARLNADRSRGRSLARLAAGPVALAALTAAACAAGAADVKPTDKVYKDWHVSCATGKPCLAYFVGPGAHLIIGAVDANGVPRAVLHLPATAKVGSPVAVRLNKGWMAQLKVTRCNDKYCEAPVPADKTGTFVTPLKADSGGVVAYVAGQDIMITSLSLAGFQEAIKSIKMGAAPGPL